MLLVFHSWSPLTIWPEGALVRHSKGLFRAAGKQNTAVPGDSHHSRFYVSNLTVFTFTYHPVCYSQRYNAYFLLQTKKLQKGKFQKPNLNNLEQFRRD